MVGILIYPQVEELDFVGPFEIMTYINKVQPDSTKVLLIAEKLEPVQAFNGMRILPDLTLEECPQLDILVLPGGKGRFSAMKNPAIIDFILRQSKDARYMTSVCTGAFLLAEAGLLKGKKATTYHTAFSELQNYSVDVLNKKVVQDGTIITAGGVSSGIELGFYLLKILFGSVLAEDVARKVEYSIDVNNI
jgi:cyclohexyl-isocyanide hydratase